MSENELLILVIGILIVVLFSKGRVNEGIKPNDNDDKDHHIDDYDI